MERNLKESSKNKWLVVRQSIFISQFVYQLLETVYGTGRGVELIRELTIFLDGDRVTSGTTASLAFVSVALRQSLPVMG